MTVIFDNRKGKFNNKKIVLGLSGGVDSTAAALLLKEQGFEVIGLYFDVSCGNEDGIAKAKKAAEQIGIKLIVKNVNEMFSNTVIDNFIDEYAHGRTPNPCTLCNPEVKFKVLIEAADAEEASFIATGHYAITGYSEEQGCYTVKTADNISKDQSYMLYRLPKEWIQRLVLPLSHIDDKEKTRQLARENDMFNAEAKDSQEICFLENDMSYVDFLESMNVPIEPGKFIDKDGNILGENKGIIHYTIGQRKGLGIALGKPAFVTEIRPDNTVVLGENDDLFACNVFCNKVFFTATGSEQVPEFTKGTKLKGKIRYKAVPSPCTVEGIEDGKICVTFDEAQRAATPGQSLVLYYEDQVIGGGIIERTEK